MAGKVAQWALAACLGMQMTLANAADHPPGCERGDCGIRQASAYGNLVVGRVAHVATDEEMRRLYRWARDRAWKDFPDDEADYLQRNRVFILPADDQGTPVMLHMSHEEYRRITFHEGDLVRYIPRSAGGSGPAPSIYSTLAGCIAILCRAQDTACAARYPTGVFRHGDGVQIDFKTEQPVTGGIVIDLLSLLPRSGAAEAGAK